MRNQSLSNPWKQLKKNVAVVFTMNTPDTSLAHMGPPSRSYQETIWFYLLRPPEAPAGAVYCG